MRRFEEVFTKSHHLHSIKTSRSTEYDRLLGQLFYLCSSYSHYASAMPQGQSWPSCPGVRTERQRVADSSQSGRQHLELPLCHIQISPDISRYLRCFVLFVLPLWLFVLFALSILCSGQVASAPGEDCTDLGLVDLPGFRTASESVGVGRSRSESGCRRG